MSSFSKNIQKFLIFFFTAISLVVIIMGTVRIKKTPIIADTGVPPTPPATPSDTTGAITLKGRAYQTPWGNAVASITVKDGKVIAASMPQVPNSPPSQYAEAFLVDQALRTGNANIQGVSGATYTSLAFKSSLESALSQAQAQGQTVTGGTVTTGASTPTAKPTVPRKYRRDDDDDEYEGWDD